MNKAQVDNWRVSMQNRLEELTILNAKQSSDISHVKESLDEVKTLIKEQNGRVRELEGGMSGIKAIGGMLSAVFSGLFGYLFTKG
jgi:uncharacterized coiled-coil protein SlyX